MEERSNGDDSGKTPAWPLFIAASGPKKDRAATHQECRPVREENE
jgi:hypothetical protein